MNKFARLFALLVFIILSLKGFAQDSSEVQFSYNYQRLNDSEVVFNIAAKINPGIKLFALQHISNDLLYSSIQFNPSEKKLLRDSVFHNGDEKKEMNKSLNNESYYFTDSVVWKQKIAASLSDSFLLKGTVSYLVQKGGEYLPGENKFETFILPKTKTEVAETAEVKATPIGGSVATRSLTWIFFTAFAGGLLALITPCVCSMIPVTVSFFTKRSKNKLEGIKNAIYYSASIVFIFTLLGFLITVIFGPTSLNNLATNWIANLIFFLIFFLFGISFLCSFEIALPSSWGNKADSKAGTGSFLGIFFMALTLVVVSYSCYWAFIFWVK